MKELFGKSIKAVFILTILFTFVFITESKSNEPINERVSQDITMQTANSVKDPYTLMFNINVTAPGRISVLIRKPDGSFHLGKKEILFRIVIADERGYHTGSRIVDKKHIRKVGYFKHERGLLEYSLDSFELDSSKGKFIIFITNFYQKRPYQAHLNISYPVIKPADKKLKPVEMKLKPVELKGFSGENME